MFGKSKWLVVLFILSLFTLLLAGCDMGSGKFYTVSFEANGGVPEPKAQKVQRGGLLVEPEECLKSASCGF